jgi:hypothetical protein
VRTVAARDQRRWVSVEERLPEEDKPVLVRAIVWTHGSKSGPFTALGSWSKARGEWDIEECVPERVTHWMPLPEPPA